MPEIAENTDFEIRILIQSLLEIDRIKRINPKQLYEEVMGKKASAYSSSASLISLASATSSNTAPIQ